VRRSVFAPSPARPGQREERTDQAIPLNRTIIDGVGTPILFSKAILLTAFIPLFTLQRVEGRIFQPMALTLSFALVAGTLLAVTVVPIPAALEISANPVINDGHPAVEKGMRQSAIRVQDRP
jgi:Cu/Ag efflux pump CusA